MVAVFIAKPTPAITRRKDKRHAARRQRIGNGVNVFAMKMDIENSAVEAILRNRDKCFFDSPGGARDFQAEVREGIFDHYGDEHLVFDNQNAAGGSHITLSSEKR